MKKIIVLTLFCVFVTTAFCQNCGLCGTWQGTYSLPVPDPDPDGDIIDLNMKMFVRIKKRGEDLSVRVKAYPANNPSEISYWNDCDVTSQSTTSINWSSYVRTSYDWNNSDKKNGITIYKVSYWRVCSAQLQRGNLVMTYYLFSRYFDRQENIIGTHSTPTKRITLYQEDEDW